MTQDEALAILKTGASAFLTGEPGAGKTYTINRFVEYLRRHGLEPAITASTGIAATHIGGMTIHSWSGIGIKRDLSAYDLDAISQNKNAVKRITAPAVLIIDEISMLSAATLSMVDAVCREVRRDARPFGGLTVVLVGDFFQLPPVETKGSEQRAAQEIVYDDAPPAPRFAFGSAAWDALDPLICYLTEQHRQSDEPFLEFLNAVRSGTHGEQHLALLRTRYASRPAPGVTQLYSRNANVDALNDRALGALAGDRRAFSMTSAGPANLVAALVRGCLSPETLVLKEGARVMFTKNDAAMHRYANGTLGEVAGFADGSGYPIVRTHDGATIVAEPDEWRLEEGGRVLASIRQVPLRLAWAMTVHKSQGMSLDAAHMDLSDVFEYGQGYVALSRVRSLEGLSLAGLNKRALEVHPEILAADAAFRERSDAAAEQFAALDPAELATLHENFLRAAGGSLKEIAYAPSAEPRPKQKPGATFDATRALINEQRGIAEMAKARGLTEGTIIGHVEKLLGEGKITRADIEYLKPEAKRFGKMKTALEGIAKSRGGEMPLGAAKSKLGSSYSFDDIRLARIFL
ncbi:MAG TPA: AAA family ATPase [Candidatus Paceibacterota bacterium]|nr:AAA family ATPase [Candidatus Paceibacterota bacterium]